MLFRSSIAEHGDRTGSRRRTEPQNDPSTVYNAPPPYDGTVPTEIEREPGARLSKNNDPRASASSKGAQEQVPFIPPEPKDLPRERRGLQHALKSPESSSDEDYGSAMELDLPSDSDSYDTPMSGKGKGVEDQVAPRPPPTQTYSQTAARPSNSGRSSASDAAYRHQTSHRTEEPWSSTSYGKQNYRPNQKPSLCVVGLRLPVAANLSDSLISQGL